MHSVNDDSDEIFRRAGKDYPLNTNSADWKKIADALNIDVNPSGKNKTYRKFLLLVLLLPVLWLGYLFIKEQKQSLAVRKIIPTKDVLAKTNTLRTKRENDNLQMHPSFKSIENSIAGKTNKEIHNVKTSAFVVNETLLSEETNGQTNDSQNEVSFKEGIFEIPTKINGALISVPLPDKPIHTSSALKQHTDEPQQPANQKTKTRNGFYTGFLTGTGITTVKFQKIKNSGLDIGLIAGYKFGQHWGIEAGVLSVKKNYYTKGEEFNTSKIYIPANTKITSVDGNCRMIELPVVVKYNFSSAKQHTWFAIGGVSNYLMKEEKYDYDYYYSNNGTSVKRSKTYQTPSQAWVSSAQFSVGYQKTLNHKFDIRGETYFQIPLKGVGLGSLPLTNAGLRIGITKTIF